MDLGRHDKLNAFRAEDALQFIGNIGVLSGHDPRGGLDDGHPAAETAIGLRHLQADIATAEQDHMRGQIIEFERLDMRQRPGRLEAGNVRNCRMRAQVQENPLAGKDARAPFVEVHFDGLGRDETSTPHDQFGATRSVVLQMQFDLAVDHVALALTHRGHVGFDGTCYRAELPRVMRQMRNLRAPDLILARHAGNVGTGPADPAALDDSRTSPDCAMCQANNLPPWPLPRIRTSTCSGDIGFPASLPLRFGQTFAGCGDVE